MRLTRISLATFRPNMTGDLARAAIMSKVESSTNQPQKEDAYQISVSSKRMSLKNFPSKVGWNPVSNSEGRGDVSESWSKVSVRHVPDSRSVSYVSFTTRSTRFLHVEIFRLG